jgi:sigma-B regulation protein RsbU (phosphoserine phosphatase)
MLDSAGRRGRTPAAGGHTDAHAPVARRGPSRALRPVLDSISEGVAVADTTGVLLLFNRAAERILGLGAVPAPPERWPEVYGLYLPDRVTPYPVHELPLARAVRGETAHGVEIFVRNAARPEGAVIRVDATPWRDGSGTLLGGVAVFRDVTAEQRAGETLRLLSSAVEQTTDAVYITDRRGVIEYVNGGFERMTGYTRAEALGRTPRILKSGRHGRVEYRELWETLLSGRLFHGMMVNRRRDGEVYHAEMTITPIQDSGSGSTHFVAVGRDMTDRLRRREQELELELARSVQQGLFPLRAPRVRGFDIAGTACPAAAMCGDYYDYVVLGDHRLCLAVGDVCGHGLGPALVMASTRAYLRAYLGTLPGVAETLRALNRTLAAELEDGRFVSMLLADLDTRSRTLTPANAGHLPGLVLASDGRLRALLESTAPPLGVLADHGVGDAIPIALEPGDVVVLMTDGVTESRSPDGQLLGVEGALRIVRTHLTSDARGIVDGLVAGVRDFTRGQGPGDDLAAVACRVAPGRD